MPELPEVETTKNGISTYLEGAIIEKIVVRQPKLRWMVSEELAQITQQKVIALSRRAKYLIIQLDLIDKHDHLDIVVNNGKVVRYNDPRRFGAWLWTEKLDEFPLFLKLGPEPLSEEFDSDYLWQKSRKKQTALKTFLMDNAVVVGVGNIYANETLFLCNLHPQKTAGSLTKAQCGQLVEQIKQVLSNAIQQGGTTLKDFLQPDGRPGYFVQELRVYGNKDKPCPTCGTKIESLVIGQRNSFYCPKCQKR
ncbi:bifunctional DNA-formamidopyrimidine glycosylase/DNA-(apurinic or apyrimidinic site) lyase [Pasteurella multocida]|uniref:bifunctional DNA-formamidopyrimidine glycosylase/DNA-(apurinic or apyrimidinic site) lyase n=1 Tax=Pasteurella multocida TaxID=747 RepID=UPI001F052934|nr:bifunctional DNA-formamidopyrimidine glycosylase/DNA-(apurinic or apyrimidinic site) lyase [Pasteurella multocida]MCH1906099.1 bifunctional DNA-formamidopyrimidine glycosylase/DNA-(apurinic or apyrimidinic site) lyase [Pasteurella multocida]